jgi:hypothetical protein
MFDSFSKIFDYAKKNAVYIAPILIISALLIYFYFAFNFEVDLEEDFCQIPVTPYAKFCKGKQSFGSNYPHNIKVNVDDFLIDSDQIIKGMWNFLDEYKGPDQILLSKKELDETGTKDTDWKFQKQFQQG